MHGTPLTLADDLDALALRTWQRVRWGPEWNMTLGEDGLTEENLFHLRLNHPYLNVKKFVWNEETANGADWEWWLGSDSTGWVGLRIQAKKMLHMRYDKLRYQSKSQNRIQCEVLIEETADAADGKSLIPMYCFYNGWDEANGWPDGTAWTIGCAEPANCMTVPDVSIFGCALARADHVLDVIQHASDPLSATSVLPIQRPWSWLFGGGPLNSTPLTAANVQSRITTALQLGPDMGLAPRFEELPQYATATREGWPDSDLAQVSRSAPTTYVVTADLGDQPTLG